MMGLQLLDLATASLSYLVTTSALVQLTIVAGLLLIARLIAWRLEPRLEARVRAVENPNHKLLRLTAVLLRRVWMVTFIAIGAVALALMQAHGWPAATYMVSTAILLVLAWVIVLLLAQVIPSRMIRRLVTVGVWIYAALLILGIADDAGKLLSSIGFSIGDVEISPLKIIQAFVFLAILLWAAITLGNFIDNRLQDSEDLTPSLRVLIGKVLNKILIASAVLLGLSGVGIDLTMLAVFSGAFAVGLGFGLQKVVSNYISGIIILMDRSIKPGDTISLGETFGWIRELRARFVSVATHDGREYLIPNEDFITHQVINWSFTDAMVRVDVEFGVSYDANPHEVSALAIKAATSCKRVHSDRRPVCWMTEFGDSSLNFILRFWINDPRGGLTNVRGAVLLALWDAFELNGIGIPYPHREIIVKSPVEVEAK